MAHRSQETCWTVDLIQKSKLITKGHPELYRLITTRSNLEESGKIRKWTFGQREINTENKIILLVGETGTGKTTLINAIVNYILGVKFNDNVWFEITEEREVNPTDDQTETQTTEITVYEVFAQDKQISVTVIDTPGCGDTKGAECDRQVAENLWKLFKNSTGVKEIDAVCLVVKASQNRLSDRQHYIYDAVLSLFGKDIEENIVIFVTHSTRRHPKNVISAMKKMKIPCRKTNENDPVCFLFDNVQAEQWTTDCNQEYQRAWEQTEDSLKNFFASLEDQNRKSLQMTKRVLTEQIQLKACVSNLCERIELKECKHEELTQIQKALKENQDKIQRNENFSFKVTKHYKEKVLIENSSWLDRKATCCSVCEENCHEYDCWCALRTSLCEVMEDEHCTVCTRRCHHSQHVRENKKYKTKREQVTMVFTDLIKQYEDTDKSTVRISLDSQEFNHVKKELENKKKEKKHNINVENRLREELTEIEKEKTRLVEDAYNTIVKLSEITLKPDSTFVVESLNFLIPRAEEAGRPEWVEKLKKLIEIEPEAQIRIAAALRYVGTSLTEGVKSLIAKFERNGSS